MIPLFRVIVVPLLCAATQRQGARARVEGFRGFLPVRRLVDMSVAFLANHDGSIVFLRRPWRAVTIGNVFSRRKCRFCVRGGVRWENGLPSPRPECRRRESSRSRWSGSTRCYPRSRPSPTPRPPRRPPSRSPSRNHRMRRARSCPAIPWSARSACEGNSAACRERTACPPWPARR